MSDSKLDWVQLANVGQAYGFSATIISALALIAIALSLRMQVVEARAQRRENHRTYHMQLLTMAIQDPSLADCVPSNFDTRHEKKKLYYINLWFWWWNYNYSSGLMPEEQVRRSVAYLASSELGRHYLDAHVAWRDSTVDRSQRGFFRIVDEERSKMSDPQLPLPEEEK
ncbi:DUF6082 family protein [Micromonospora sp. NPDC085948]|uniref:DUF6082 family protein n=1 Tax=Micromonospora sp. NPDC085948 TaxID=3155293 RepID=UPI003441FA22